MFSGFRKVAWGAGLLAAALLYYAQTLAFAWDEGFHLLAAQLIRNGRLLYLDFFFPQTPLNAYWNAAWMIVFGDTWRTAHAVAALCTASACLLLAQYVYEKFGASAALCSLCVFGLNTLVFRFGGIGQAYGFCLLLLVAAFRCAVLSRESESSRYAAASGFFASAAAAASLLTAPALPVFLIWLALYTRDWRKFLAFAGGSSIPFFPVFVAALKAPREVLFQVFQYNFSYRAVLWTEGSAVTNNEAVYGSFLRSPGAILLVGLSVLAMIRMRRTPEAWLCATLALCMGIYIGAPFPTFARYFCFVVPFLAILAMSALQAFEPKWKDAASFLFVLVTVSSLAKKLYDERQSYGWRQMEAIARKVDEVTAPGAPILGDEQIYFLTRRAPPSGLEHENSHKPIPLTPEFLHALHVISQDDLDQKTRAGAFATVATCDDKEWIDDLRLLKVYRQHTNVGECMVFWERKASNDN